MTDNPLHSVLILFVAGLMGDSFYVPFTKVRRWSWETHWLVMGVVAWVTMPALAVLVYIHSQGKSNFLSFYHSQVGNETATRSISWNKATAFSWG